MSHTSLRAATCLLALAGLALAAIPTATAQEDLRARMRAIKRIQIQQLRNEGKRHMDAGLRERDRDAGLESEAERRGREVDLDFLARREGVIDARNDQARLDARLRARRDRPGTPRVQGSTPIDVRVNDPVGEEIGSSQNEPSIGAWDRYVLAAFNDWPSLDSLGSIQGYAYSVDGGATFSDPGMVPHPTGFFWSSDPVITVNETTGDFFYIAMIQDNGDGTTTNGIAIARGAFVADAFQWLSVRTVRVVSTAEHFLDKPWVAVDPISGNLYITYTDFYRDEQGQVVGNAILYTRSRDNGANWDPTVQLSTIASDGNVQGSRPAVGPSGELYVVWKEIGPEDPGYDFLRLRKSTDGGATFFPTLGQPEITAATFFDNYGTGAPGFNRENSVSLPSLAVDRSSTASRGRVYVSWHESLNWFDDVPGIGPARIESENNDYFANANAFTIGQTLRGTFANVLDGFGDYAGEYDTFSFQGQQDSSYVFWADTVDGSTYRMRVWCSDTLTRLAYTGVPELPIVEENSSVMMWTAPHTGTFYLEILNARTEGRDVGSYAIRTGRARRTPGDRGRDQRDVFVASSPDGLDWSLPPVRVNQDSAHYDNWLPEVTAAVTGDVYAVWYDWRDAPAECGGMSHVYMALSSNRGDTWSALGAISDQPSDWTYVNSNLIPNQGDYIGFMSNQNAVYACWTDGRPRPPDAGGAPIQDSNIYAAIIPLLPAALQVRGSADIEADVPEVTIQWRFVEPRVVPVTIFRRDDSGIDSIASATTDGLGRVTFVDTTVIRNVRYVYSLGVDYQGEQRRIGEVVVMIPSVSALALSLGPNPWTLKRGLATIRYSVPLPGGQVKITVHDLGGRKIVDLVDAHRGSGNYVMTWNAADQDGRRIPAGVYLVRMSVLGHTTTRRVSFVP